MVLAGGVLLAASDKGVQRHEPASDTDPEHWVPAEVPSAAANEPVVALATNGTAAAACTALSYSCCVAASDLRSSSIRLRWASAVSRWTRADSRSACAWASTQAWSWWVGLAMISAWTTLPWATLLI